MLEYNRSRAAWWAIGAGLAAAFGFVVYSFVGTVVFGVFLYYATRPVYRKLQARLGNRTLSAGIAMGALAGPALALTAYALALVVSQAERFLGDLDVFDLSMIPGVDQQLLQRVTDPATLLTIDWMQYVSTATIASTLQSLGDAADVLAVFGVGALHLFVMLAIAFYLLRDGRRLADWLRTFSDDSGVMVAYGEAVDRDFQSIFFGNILNAVFTGTIGVMAYSLLNLFAPAEAAIPAAALVGLLAGVASLVPVVGMKLVYFPVAGFMGVRTLATGTTETAWFVLAFAVVSFIVVDTGPDLLLRPYVSGRSLHVGAVMLAYTLGPLLFGWYGIFLLPILLVLVVQFARIVLPELAAGRPIRPYEIDSARLDDSGGPPAPTAVSPDNEATDGSGRDSQPNEMGGGQQTGERDSQPDGTAGGGETDGRDSQPDGTVAGRETDERDTSSDGTATTRDSSGEEEEPGDHGPSDGEPQSAGEPTSETEQSDPFRYGSE